MYIYRERATLSWWMLKSENWKNRLNYARLVDREIFRCSIVKQYYTYIYIHEVGRTLKWSNRQKRFINTRSIDGEKYLGCSILIRKKKKIELLRLITLRTPVTSSGCPAHRSHSLIHISCLECPWNKTKQNAIHRGLGLFLARVIGLVLR